MAKKNVNVEEMVTIRGTVKLVKEYQELAELEALIKNRMDELKEEVMDKMAAKNITECKAGNFKVNVQYAHNSGTIDKAKLEAKYPEIYKECYKAPKKEITKRFIVKAFSACPKTTSTTKIFDELVAKYNMVNG